MSPERDLGVPEALDVERNGHQPESVEEAFGEVRRGNASWTPLAVFGGVSLAIAVVAGLVILVLLLIYLL